ncbi:plasmid replication/partition related protein [Aquabacterium sp. A08]|uniref:plasmid replication/partition related protein n=1 Tax=Aquabacterium sp. A08 TaxID=2718532 RepID=UPI001421D7F2|nr:plasmid replication/partition related protein [Aquabacterium sp. A08]NIC42869.1 plasmid replication/partition related protein [Aquabacterium sp. A08]
MHLVVDPELQAYIDPLTPDEHAALERSLLTEGCRDALVLWGDLLVDGHNRYAICQKHGLPFQTVQSQLFQSREDVLLWMIDQHLGRRSVSDFQRGVLALRKRDLIDQRRAAYLAASAAQAPAPGTDSDADDDLPWEGEATPAIAALTRPLKSREDIARAARLSSNQVVMIEKIHKQAAPEVVTAVKVGALSLNAAAAVATLPPEEQQAAASAGMPGLKQAAKRVREAKRKHREAAVPAPADAGTAAPVAAGAADELAQLRRQVQQLTAENQQLRKQVATLLERQLAPGTPAAD